MDVSIKYSSERTFYEKAEKIIKTANEAEDVLIYLKNDQKVEWKNSHDDNFDQNLNFRLPDSYAKEKGFAEWLFKCVKNKHLNSFYINNDNKYVRSAAFMRADSDTDNRDCFIILINKRHKPSQSCVYYNNIFDKDNYYITSQCCVF